jgi:Chaperone of endosialidase
MSLGITGAVIGGAATIGSTILGANASKKASQDEINAANAANAQQRKDQAPWTTAGGTAVTQLAQETQPGGVYGPDATFTMADAQNSDAETYAQRQALNASEASAAARGGLIGTGEQNELQTNAAGIASQYQGQAFNQWLASRQQSINAQQSLAGEGLSGAQNVADTGANLTVGAGNAAAAGTVGSTNAITGGVSSLGSQLTTLSKLFGTNTPTSTGGEGIDVGSYNPGADSAAADTPGLDWYGNPIPGATPSDERLKTDIRRVGKTDEGVPIYTYRMKSGGPYKMGVMAQDIEKSNPRAVTKLPNSLRMVDYRRIS